MANLLLIIHGHVVTGSGIDISWNLCELVLLYTGCLQGWHYCVLVWLSDFQFSYSYSCALSEAFGYSLVN